MVDGHVLNNHRGDGVNGDVAESIDFHFGLFVWGKSEREKNK